MTDGRNELARFIMDERNSHMACVGAAVAFMRVNTKFGRRIADAIDETIKREIKAIQAEQQRDRIDPEGGIPGRQI